MLEHAIRFVDKEIKYINNLTVVSTSDIHFGAMDPQYQYNTLKKQMIEPLYNSQFDIFAICGDYFEHKFMANSDAIMYGLLFFDDVVNLCISKNATLLIISGTKKHDDDQLKMFYKYLNNPNIDIRIVEHTKFEYIKGAKVLCIPEEYNKDDEYYYNFLYAQGYYDFCVVHGMYKGAVYQNETINTDNSTMDNRIKVFTIDDFQMCRGMILAGHIHTPGCFNSYFYYCGSPYVWRFGEEHAKGFLVTLLDLTNGQHYTHFQEINCMRYVTINIDNLLHEEPDVIIQYIQYMSNDIDFIRIELNNPNQACMPTLEILKKYYRNNNNIKLNVKNKEKEKINEEVNNLSEEYKKYDYLLDKQLTCYEKFVKYVNQMEGELFITVEELIDILKEV